MDTNRRKLFFGLALSPALRRELSRLVQAWPEEALILTREENFHVTLYFLGFVAEAEIPGISEKIREIMKNQESFEITFKEITLIPDGHNPKMIYLSGEPSAELLSLQESVEKVFSPYLTAKKSYRPHATLARVRRAQWAKLPAKPALPAKVHYTEPVDSLTLFESVVIEGKRSYVAIDTYPLK